MSASHRQMRVFEKPPSPARRLAHVDRPLPPSGGRGGELCDRGFFLILGERWVGLVVAREPGDSARQLCADEAVVFGLDAHREAAATGRDRLERATEGGEALACGVRITDVRELDAFAFDEFALLVDLAVEELDADFFGPETAEADHRADAHFRAHGHARAGVGDAFLDAHLVPVVVEFPELLCELDRAGHVARREPLREGVGAEIELLGIVRDHARGAVLGRDHAEALLHARDPAAGQARLIAVKEIGDDLALEQVVQRPAFDRVGDVLGLQACMPA